MKESDYRALVFSYLAIDDYKSAAKLLWPWIEQNEWSDLIWDQIQNNDYSAIIGHASASKTFTAAQYYLMDWWKDPQNTAVVITSDTSASMSKRVWSDVKMLFKKTRVPMIGILRDSKKMIVYDVDDEKNAISAIAAESDDAQSKIQGIHTKRVRVLIDEADNKFSNSIWGAIANLGTSGGIKVTALANLEDPQSKFGQHIEPSNGFASINPESDFKWISKMNYAVLRLDGLKSPNMLAGYDKHPFLLTMKGVKDIEENNGIHSIEWWKYVRAWYSPSGQTSSIFNDEIVQKCREKKIVWYAGRTRFASADPAFEDGGDKFMMCFGWVGRLAEDPTMTCVEIDKFIHVKRTDMKKEDLIDFGDQVIAICKSEGVAPEHFGMDATGNAHGLAGYIRHNWSTRVHKVIFGGSPTDMKIIGEDSLPASQRFDRFVTELWFSAREWCKFGHVQFNNPPLEFTQELTSRQYSIVSKKISIETKRKMKGRHMKSPDHSDAFAVLMHIIRIWKNTERPNMSNKERSKDPLKRFRVPKTAFVPNYVRR